MNPLSTWKYIRPFTVGGDTVMTFLMRNIDETYGIMKLVYDNEADMYNAMYNLSYQYPYYVRVLHSFHTYCNHDLIHKGYRKWDDADYEGEYVSTEENTYGIEFCTGKGSLTHHYIFEKLDQFTYKQIRSNKKTLLITTIHMLIGHYIAKDTIGFAHGDYQILIRKTDPYMKYIHIKYKDLDVSIPNIGFIPVMYDYGHSSTGNEKSNDLINILLYFQFAKDNSNPLDIYIDDHIRDIMNMFKYESGEQIVNNMPINYESSLVKDIILNLLNKL